MIEASGRDRYFDPGTRVVLRNPPEGSPEHGVVVHCWGNDETSAYDCYVAFFGSEAPDHREPATKPYVLRYAARSLQVAEPSPQALMLRDTVLDMKEHLEGLTDDTDFNRGYSMGYEFATRTLKRQCDAFGLSDDLGWMEPDLAKWVKRDD